jgi:hypothetical protein
VIEELGDAPRLSAEQAVQRARRAKSRPTRTPDLESNQGPTPHRRLTELALCAAPPALAARRRRRANRYMTPSAPAEDALPAGACHRLDGVVRR